ncbi:hypothetical protein TNCV_4002151 [Trichonephila clavipes]|uniref:Uncharacterized protein n=1 Tax=Trichonephila clavipes TaxID=2585209 RepID=A0A8X6UZ71_TRICX|nr:hypothetical protein TNCV_4002151 [Trichonephila clavipes]
MEVEIEVVLPSIVPSGNFAELNRTVTCMVLKANDRRTSCPCHDEFRGSRSDYVRQFECLKELDTDFPEKKDFFPDDLIAESDVQDIPTETKNDFGEPVSI